MSSNFSISVILPTFNEQESLTFFIPELEKVLINYEYEILIVDDNSTDNTAALLADYSFRNSKIKLIQRSDKPSLPLSIYEGIKNSSKDFVMWLDADGSMDGDAVLALIKCSAENRETVFVGSRFVKGGGYKGKEENESFNLKKFFNSIVDSEDSFLAIFLSLVFNKFLSILLNIDVRDLTSGFIIGKKDLFVEEMFKGYVYGEYFINVLSILQINNIDIFEVGYFCKPRMYGESKTSTNIFRLVKLLKPYIFTAIKSRKLINENL